MIVVAFWVVVLIAPALVAIHYGSYAAYIAYHDRNVLDGSLAVALYAAALLSLSGAAWMVLS